MQDDLSPKGCRLRDMRILDEIQFHNCMLGYVPLHRNFAFEQNIGLNSNK
ncbi:MAG: hypothetical protein A4E23_01315 [Methanomethylovorans sp. PtaU1.Bin073]|nr:MAG: hypothetical protein A4E23_01315 [Methanomethylovorans sp. PtaU1.Bin073]